MELQPSKKKKEKWRKKKHENGEITRKWVQRKKRRSKGKK